jgi:hypothetical protein
MIARRKPAAKLTPQERAILAQEPPLDTAMAICIDAWERLDSARLPGLRPMAVPKSAPILVPFYGPIPWPAIESYARHKGLGVEATEAIALAIEHNDAIRTKRQNDEMRRQR